MEHPAGIGGMPQASGIAARFGTWLGKHSDMPGAGFLSEMTQFAVKKFGFEGDAFVHELVDSIIGDNYPVPDRMLVHNERIVHEYLMWAMCGEPRPLGKITNLVKTKRPDLMLLTDDVYGTFVDEFRSLLGELPQNTIGVYSYSKYFGCTGWRLGVIAVHEDSIFDKMIAKLPEADVKALDKRCRALTLEPRKIKFIDRIVADSRDVALNHTAGLSLPQQVMMSLFSLAEMMDTEKRYQVACKEIVHRRIQTLIASMGLQL